LSANETILKINGFFAGITLAMALLPEEFPVIFTVFPAPGVFRMSKIKY
jgi:Ca2+-transporting ATPase